MEGNKVEEIDEVYSLRGCQKLQYVELEGNPILDTDLDEVKRVLEDILPEHRKIILGEEI